MLDFSKIGNTPLLPLRMLGGFPLKAKVLIKDESENPTGTHKDRKSARIIERALAHNINTLAIITSGNAGYSLTKLAEGTPLRVATVVSQNIRQSIKDGLADAGADVFEYDLSKKLESDDIIEIVRQYSDEKIWDASNDLEDAYEDVFHEIAHEKPDIVVAPLGSGELYLGLDRGMRRCGSKTTLVGVEAVHPETKADKLYAKHAPLRHRILLNQLQRKSPDRGHTGIFEEDIEWCIEHAPEGLRAEPSALVVFNFIRCLRNQALKIIAINTGKGLQ